VSLAYDSAVAQVEKIEYRLAYGVEGGRHEIVLSRNAINEIEAERPGSIHEVDGQSYFRGVLIRVRQQRSPRIECHSIAARPRE
jgi:hypothetical protein